MFKIHSTFNWWASYGLSFGKHSYLHNLILITMVTFTHKRVLPLLVLLLVTFTWSYAFTVTLLWFTCIMILYFEPPCLNSLLVNNFPFFMKYHCLLVPLATISGLSFVPNYTPNLSPKGALCRDKGIHLCIKDVGDYVLEVGKFTYMSYPSTRVVHEIYFLGESLGYPAAVYLATKWGCGNQQFLHWCDIQHCRIITMVYHWVQ